MIVASIAAIVGNHAGARGRIPDFPSWEHWRDPHEAWRPIVSQEITRIGDRIVVVTLERQPDHQQGRRIARLDELDHGRYTIGWCPLKREAGETEAMGMRYQEWRSRADAYLTASIL